MENEKLKRIKNRIILRESSNSFVGGCASTTSALLIGLLTPEAIALVSLMGKILPLFDGIAITIPHRVSEKLGWLFHLIGLLCMIIGPKDPITFAIIITIVYSLSALTRISYDEFVRDIVVRTSTPVESKKFKGLRNSLRSLFTIIGIGVSVLVVKATDGDWRAAYFIIAGLEVLHMICKIQLNFEMKGIEED